ncbi:MAG: type II CAAX endopeptidase family protein [Clostridia bacterium]|nr:type II CAAX endopeptidase family protein [Clostridia bacterium]
MEKQNVSVREQGFKTGVLFNVFIAANLIFLFLLQAIANTVCERYTSAHYLLVSLSTVFALAAVLIVGKTVFGFNAKNLMVVRRFSRTFSGLAIVLSFGMLFGLGFINEAFVRLLSAIGLKVNGFTWVRSGTGDYLIGILALCVIPAVFEELFFRGVLLSCLKNTGIILSSVITALFFALYHGSAAQLIYQFIYGFFLSVMTWRANSVYPAIISHFLNNFAVLSFEYFGIAVNFFSITFILMGIAFLVSFAFIMLLFKRSAAKREKGAVKAAFFPFGIIGVLICVAMIVLGFFA